MSNNEITTKHCPLKAGKNSTICWEDSCSWYNNKMKACSIPIMNTSITKLQTEISQLNENYILFNSQGMLRSKSHG